MLRFPSTPSNSTKQWFDLYQAAMFELDDNKVPLRIAEARRAIHDRIEKILTVSTESERRNLNDALHVLNVLEKITKQGTPPVTYPNVQGNIPRSSPD